MICEKNLIKIEINCKLASILKNADSILGKSSNLFATHKVSFSLLTMAQKTICYSECNNI